MIFCSLDLRRAHDKEGCVKKCDLDEWMRRLREEKMFQCEKCGLIFSSESCTNESPLFSKKVTNEFMKS